MSQRTLSRRQMLQLTAGALAAGALVGCTGQRASIELYWRLTSNLFHEDYNHYVYEQLRTYAMVQGWPLHTVDHCLESSSSENNQADEYTHCVLHIFATAPSGLSGHISSTAQIIEHIQQRMGDVIPLLQTHRQAAPAAADMGRWLVPYHRQSGGVYYRRCTFNVAEAALQNEHFMGTKRLFYS